MPGAAAGRDRPWPRPVPADAGGHTSSPRSHAAPAFRRRVRRRPGGFSLSSALHAAPHGPGYLSGGGFFRSTSIVGAATLLSRVTGLLRDMVYSRMFGAGLLMDAFLVAFKIPNFMRRLFAEGAFSQAFVPVVSEYKVQRAARRGARADRRRDGHDDVVPVGDHDHRHRGGAGAGARVCAGFPRRRRAVRPHGRHAALDVPLHPVHLARGAGGRRPQQLRQVRRAGDDVDAHEPRHDRVRGMRSHRTSNSRASCSRSACSCRGWCSSPSSCRSCSSSGCCAGRAGAGAHEGVRKIGRLMLPAIFGSSVSQVALLLDTLIASFLATGSIAWLYYADRLVEFPLGVFSIALATVILPGLAAHHASQSPERFASTLDWAVQAHDDRGAARDSSRCCVLAGPLTVVIFHYGKFDEQDVRMSTLALMAYSTGLMGFSMVKVLAPGLLRAAGHQHAGARSASSRSCSTSASTSPSCCRSRSSTRAGPGCTRCSRSTPASAPGTTRRCSTAACAAQHVLHHCPGLAPHAVADARRQRARWDCSSGSSPGDTARWLAMHAWQRASMDVAARGRRRRHLLRHAVRARHARQHLRVRSVAIPARPVGPAT